MTTSDSPCDTLSVPQPVLDHYRAQYDNTTYRAFSQALAKTLPDGEDNMQHVALMNLLIDASLERAGATTYAGACLELGAALAPYGESALFSLAEQHLCRFNPTAEETVLTGGLLDMLKMLQTLAETAARTASAYHGWRGRVVCWWLDALASLAQAAHAVLHEGYTSYAEEKLTAALGDLHAGMDECTTGGGKMGLRLVAWLLQFPKVQTR
jgi:hypothetical protein